jgi:hypothetical protein
MGLSSGTRHLLREAVIPRARHSGSVVEIHATRGGHFFTEVEIDGQPITIMVDTGATMVALSYEDAERAGIFLNPGDFTLSVSTANGRARFWAAYHVSTCAQGCSCFRIKSRYFRSPSFPFQVPRHRLKDARRVHLRVTAPFLEQDRS